MNVFLILLAMQLTTAPGPATQPSASIITIGPGDETYERFGHNMIRLRDPGRGIDVVYNWGIFDFNQPHFIFNFIQGRMWYVMAGWYTDQTIEEYIKADRTIWEQELNLSPAQVAALLDFCQWNSKPENRGYRYDYYRDDCSTRVRDALDMVVRGQIKAAATTMPSSVTFRSETLRLMADEWPLYLALDYVLGRPTDRPLNAWEETFIPMRLRERLNQISIIDDTGQHVPLVRRETVLHASQHIVERPAPPLRAPIFFTLGSALAAVMAGGVRSGRRLGRLSFVIVALFWALLCSLGGTILLYLWIFTDHQAAGYNDNILQLNPLLLPLLLLAPLALRKRQKGMRIALWLAGIALGCSIVGLLLRVLPIMNHQMNGNIIALALPVNAGLFAALWMVSKRPKDSSPAIHGA